MADVTGNDRIHLTVDEARALGEAAMRGPGFDDEDARILTDHVLDAALCGYATPRQTGISGIRIPGERSYATRARLVREGIEIDRKIHDALGRLAEGNLDHGGRRQRSAQSAAVQPTAHAGGIVFHRPTKGSRHDES